MITTVFCSEDLPPAERLPYFDGFLLNSGYPMRVTSTSPEHFRATVRALFLGPVTVMELTCSPSVVRRTAALIRRSDPEMYSVVFPRRGDLMVTQAGREAMLSGRDFALCDSSQPFETRIPGEGTTTLVYAHAPRALLPFPAERTRRLLGTRLPGQMGVGALLTQFLTDMTVDSASLAVGATQLSTTALDLMAASLAHHLDGFAWAEDDSDQHAMLLRIESFIHEHLSDPDLSPQAVATAHHISVSYLHRLFRVRDTTVMELIRRQRLERARRDLADLRLRDIPVHRIAASWGFRDHATFTRAFRAAYGMPPSIARRN
ncbi:helix-turn-helix domain-containing protein [Streptomyces sp. NK08204]|uniref:helix-turn-helix domain-containing protein n=1 Tax=Streptomyces sp. NK08204 TaxID=2873260 RepID=UPI001CEDB218|nr:helix-turn-helix domain-containing protein [Streptomyces sp. NK08204]